MQSEAKRKQTFISTNEKKYNYYKKKKKKVLRRRKSNLGHTVLSYSLFFFLTFIHFLLFIYIKPCLKKRGLRPVLGKDGKKSSGMAIG